MTELNAHLDEGTIHAWLDGALAPDESARVEAHAARCTECAALVAEARGLVAASSRILSSLDAVPPGVIPGATREVDQLAALRARRAVTRRSWFRDPRFVAAASLVFMAGTAGVVWQATRGASLMETPSSSVADQIQVPLSQDTQAPTPSAAPAPSLEAKAMSPRSTRDVAARQRSARFDSMATGNRAGDLRGTVGAAANEEVRRERSDVAELRASTAQAPAAAPTQAAPPPPAPITIEQQSRQQGIGAAQATFPGRLSTDTGRVVATPPAERAFKALAPEPGGVRFADAIQPAPGCYELSLTTEGRLARTSVPDVVQLLSEQVAVLSDPVWFRARGLRAGADSTLAWRSIDSITVELRGQNGSDSTAVRFQVRPRVVSRSGQRVSTMVPDVQGVPGVVAVRAALVSCR